MTLPGNLIPSQGPVLSRERKAAMVVQMMLAGGRRLPLDQLPESTQLRLTRELAQLRLVDKETVDTVASEFAQALDTIGIAAPGSVEAAISALDGQISDDAMSRLKTEIGRGPKDDPWARIVKLSCDEIKRIMETEAAEVSAVLLSKLPAGLAAEALGSLPGPRARTIALAVSQTADVSPRTVQDIGSALVTDYINDEVIAFSVAPAPRIGAILNITKADTRESLLEGLDEVDPEFAEEVRRNIFTFLDIPARVEATDVPKVLRLIDNEDLITAMAGAANLGEAGIEARDYVLDNMSKRMADNLRDELAERGKVKVAAGEAAMTIFITAIRDSAERGEIKLIDPDEDEEE